MTSRRISELASIGSPLTLGELMPAVQAGSTTRVTIEQVRGGRILSIRDFGAVGDGKADDTAAFVAMHGQLTDEQRRDPALQAVITLPPGHYRYSWNRWLWGLRHVTVDGYGARLECISESAWNLDKFPLVTNRNGFQTMQADQPGLSAQMNAGCLIETAGPGASIVRLRDSNDAARFLAGRFVLVMSFDQQFTGYPPNYRYFDYAVVVSVSGVAVTLDRPLRHLHRDDYPELTDDAIGRARILDIDRDDVPFAHRQTLLGVTLLTSPHITDDNAHYLLAQGVFSFAARDCQFDSFVASVGHEFIVDNCAMAYSEPDKLVSTLAFSNCRIGELTQATGVDKLNAINCSFMTKAQAQARSVAFQGCTFAGACQPGEYQRGIDLVGFAPVRSVSISDSLFYGKGGPTDTAIGPIGTPSNGLTAVTLEAPIQHRGRQNLLIPKTDKRARTLLQSLDVGTCVWFGTQLNGELMCDGRYGWVEGIKAVGDDVLFELFLSAPVTAKDVLIVARTQRLRSVGNVYENLSTQVPVCCSSTFEEAVVNSERYTFRLRSDFAVAVRSVSGYLRSVYFDVLKPYTGPDENANLRVELLYPAVPSFLQSVDLRQVGRRGVDGHAVVGATPLDALSPLSAEQFVWSVRFSHSASPNGRSVLPAGDVFEEAECLVTVVTANPFQLGA